MESPKRECSRVTFQLQLWNFDQWRTTELGGVVELEVLHHESWAAQTHFEPANPHIQARPRAKAIFRQRLEQRVLQENQGYHKDDGNDEQPKRPANEKFHCPPDNTGGGLPQSMTHGV